MAVIRIRCRQLLSVGVCKPRVCQVHRGLRSRVDAERRADRSAEEAIARGHPEQALDELEEKVLGGRADQVRQRSDEGRSEGPEDEDVVERGPGSEPS
jgi:hypothetical protein